MITGRAAGALLKSLLRKRTSDGLDLLDDGRPDFPEHPVTADALYLREVVQFFLARLRAASHTLVDRTRKYLGRLFSWCLGHVLFFAPVSLYFCVAARETTYLRLGELPLFLPEREQDDQHGEGEDHDHRQEIVDGDEEDSALGDPEYAQRRDDGYANVEYE